MFSLSDLPTDNFYKFLTISGLAIILFSFYLLSFNVSSAIEYNKEIIVKDGEWFKKDFDLKFKSAELKYETLILKRYSNRYNNDTLGMVQVKTHSKIPRITINDSIFEKDTLDATLRNLILNRVNYIDTSETLIIKRVHELILNLDSETVSFKSNHEYNSKINRHYVLTPEDNQPINWNIYAPGIIVFTPGILILITGLFLWYKRHQKLLDKILEKQALESQKTE